MIPKIKICGLSRPEDIEAVNLAGADYAGFVFFEKSKRNISYKKAESLMTMLDKSIKKVAVCVSPREKELERMAGLGIDIIQIHGYFPEDEVLEKICAGKASSAEKADEDACAQQMSVKEQGRPDTSGKTASADASAQVPGCKSFPEIWQAVNIKDGIRSELFSKSPYISGYVVDGADYGGGKTFDWDKINGRENADKSGDDGICAKGKNPIRECIPAGADFILAGGLNSENVLTGIELFSPDIVDISSGVEENGFKSKKLIDDFILRVRSL